MAGISPSRFVIGGLLLGAACGTGVAAVLAGWAVGTSSVEPLAAVLFVPLGALAGGAIGLGSSTLAAAANWVLAGRVDGRAQRTATAAAAALGAASVWLLGTTRTADWMHERWMLVAVTLAAAALAAYALPRSEGAHRTTRPALAPLLVVGALVSAGFGTAGAGIAGVGPLADRLGGVHEVLTPVAASAVAGGRGLSIGVPWDADAAGWCVQFTVEAVETPTEVRVLDVESRSDHNLWGGICLGVSTADGLAWADLTLAAPLGDRAVVRDQDGAPLGEPAGGA